MVAAAAVSLLTMQIREIEEEDVCGREKMQNQDVRRDFASDSIIERK
jgi:hypothetical protein